MRPPVIETDRLDFVYGDYQWPELFFLLRREHWGRGYATECAKAVVEYGFRELLLNRIGAGCEPTNLASKRVLEKIGMKPLDDPTDDGYRFLLSRGT